MLTVEERSYAVLDAIGEIAAKSAASGRYRHSEELSPGLRFWSSSFDRDRTDALGVQFTASALEQAKQLRRVFLDAGYEERDLRDPSKVTFCKRINRNPNAGLDVPALKALKAEILSLVGRHGPSDANASSREDFVTFMRRSPLYGVALDMGERTVDAERDTI